MFKPVIDIRRVKEILAGCFDAPVEDLEPIDVGQMARVFSFKVAGEGYVARFANKRTAESIEKDRFVAERLVSSSVPVPPIIHSGSAGGLYYGIAPRAPGSPLLAVHGEDNWPVVTPLIETLDAIHQADVSDTIGYGMFNGEGRGAFGSWRECLKDVALEGGNDSFFGPWHHYFDTFLDRELFDLIYDRMVELLPFCPEERFLVHGDYAYGNVIVEGQKITAVLDWANAMYGDFLFDIAWMDLGCLSRITEPCSSAITRTGTGFRTIMRSACSATSAASAWTRRSGTPRRPTPGITPGCVSVPFNCLSAGSQGRDQRLIRARFDRDSTPGSGRCQRTHQNWKA